MIELVVSKTAAKKLAKEILAVFSDGARKTRQALSTPAGVFYENVWINDELDMWAYIGPQGQNGSYNFWLNIGVPSSQTAIEINIPGQRTLHSAGQMVRREDGRICLAHRGGLGGGRWSVSVEAFCGLVSGFERDSVRAGKRDIELFVIGAPDDPDFLTRLEEYVREAVRIRQLRRDAGAYSKALLVTGANSIGKSLGTGLSDEPGGDGSYALSKRRIAFKRLHQRVQKALVAELMKRKFHPANGRLHGGIGPDLYLVGASGRMSTLFEIKVGRDAQSTFTAIGQLMVYSEQEGSVPRRILVTQGLPASRNFKSAIESLDIEVLYYEIDPKIRFKNFGELSIL